MKVLGVIPSRYASSRFPGKPLVDIKGKSMVQRVYLQAQKAKSIDKVIVATDDQRIFDHVKSWGGEVVMTSTEHPSGTDRCREVLEQQKSVFDVVVNIQGDEPYIDPSQIESVVKQFENTETQIASLAKKIISFKELFSPNTVKVIIGENKKALYFSRAAIPFLRDVDLEEYLNKGTFFKHIGLYAYRSNTLTQITELPISDLEKSEALEQLRWLSAGFQINMGITTIEGLSVDTPEDLLILTNNS